jgi:hypothetical protein
MKTKKDLENDLRIWLSFMENGKLSQRFREYAAGKVNEIEVILLD